MMKTWPLIREPTYSGSSCSNGRCRIGCWNKVGYKLITVYSHCLPDRVCVTVTLRSVWHYRPGPGSLEACRLFDLSLESSWDLLV